jgi:hypothetical protein
MPSTDWLQLCDDIDDGEFDSGLEEIAKAVHDGCNANFRKAIA